MSPQDAFRQATEAFNRHDAAAAAERFSEDAVVHDPQYTEPVRGRDAIRKDTEAWFRSIPDVHAELRSVLEDGNTYAFELAMSGTHQGPISTPSGEIPPSGKRIEMSFGAFGTMDGENKVVEERRYYDVAGLAEQLGATG
jgi:steroid delta-isomerase-like uncharacterized protein